MKVGGIVFYTKKGGRKDEKYQMDVVWNYVIVGYFFDSLYAGGCAVYRFYWHFWGNHCDLWHV
jgi:hypothetical protein